MPPEQPPLEALLCAAIAAIRVVAPVSFSWLGARETPVPLPLRRTLPRRDLLAALRRSLTVHLYTGFYSSGGVLRVPSPDDFEIWNGEWVEHLSRANTTTACRDEGWTEVRREARRVIVRKEGLTLAVDAGSTRRSRGGLSILLPNEYLKLSPGFYTAAGNAALPSRGKLFRVYWNLRPEGAAAFVRAGTRLLNAAGLPFGLKVVADPRAFHRCDTAVVYALRRDRAAVFAAVRAMRTLLKKHLRPATPVFTKRLAPGIAVAEEPPTAESFGESRCRILAEALIAYRGDPLDLERRVETVRASFARRGIPLLRAFLNPGSSDVYPMIEEPGARGVTAIAST